MIDDDALDELLEYIRMGEMDDARAWLSEQIYGSEPIQLGGYTIGPVSNYTSSAKSESGPTRGRKSWSTRAAGRAARKPKLPARIREMRALARSPEAQHWPEARLFVEQARLMEDFEDDCPYTPRPYFDKDAFYGTYTEMTDQQLRGYFTWRAQVRGGTVERGITGFAFVYINELLNGIGVEPGEPAFRAIESFWQAYRAFDLVLDSFVPIWLTDYAVFHNLDPKLPRPYLTFGQGETLALLIKAQESVLKQPAAQRGRRREPYPFGQNPDAEARLLEALDAVSTYKPLGSRLYKDDPEALRSVTAAVFARLVRYYHNSRHQDLMESLFGVPYEFYTYLFDYAVVWQDGPHPDCDYELDAACRFTCKDGRWRCWTLDARDERSSRMGEVLRATDRLLRAALGYPHPLKDRGEPKYVVQLIEREVRDFMAWRDARSVRRVEIDVSKLAGIRSAAAVTREALLVDEEREEVAAERDAGPEAPVAETDEATSSALEAAAAGTTDGTTADAPLGLNPDELGLIEDLLAGRKPAAASTDLLVDSINEKLFDLVGDTVLEFGDAGEPSLIEDYVEDVRAALA